jgi:hypothetical protein
MPRVSTKKPKEQPAEEISPAIESPLPVAAPAEEIPAAAPEPSGSAGLRPPSTPVEPTNDDTRFEERRGYQRDKIAASINIAKLQAMNMT